MFEKMLFVLQTFKPKAKSDLDVNRPLRFIYTWVGFRIEPASLLNKPYFLFSKMHFLNAKLPIEIGRVN